MSSYSPNPTAAAQPAVTVRRSRRRIGILALLAIGTMINYLDRTVLGIAAPKLTAELGIDPAIMGILFSAFAWTYALAQIPGGLFLDRFGNKVTYFLSLTLWSLFTLFHGMAVGLKTLLLCRFGLGISEAPCFPVNSRVVSAWFPQQERAKATAVYTVGEYLGLACFAPLLFWIMDGFGWRVLFVSVGAVGILFALVWWRCYREPHEDPRLSQQEREHIENGGGLSAPTDQQVAFSWPLIRQLLSKRQIIGASIGQFAGNTVLVFFLTWFPTWLAGDLAGMNWSTLQTALLPALIGLGVALLIAPRLNVLALGDKVALGLGVNLVQTRLLGLLAIALLCGAAVAVAGPIGFVGLVVPHVVRRLVTEDIRLALPLAAPVGALALVLADIAARTLVAPQELATGAMTALVGAPLFIFIAARFFK
ncbi:MFS transporter [Klebsiella pneumoniae]